MLDCVRGYKIKLAEKTKQVSIPKTSIPNLELKRYEEAIAKLLSKGAIEKCEPEPDQFISSFFLVPKPDGSYRFILNLKRLNKYIKPDHFKMEDLRTVSRLVFPNFFMATIDIQDAYYLVPIHKASRKLLRFYFQGTLYQFTCLVFGLCTSPYVFTKMLKPVMKILRAKGFSSGIYLDDIICIEENFEKCQANVRESVELLETLGFIVNKKKCKLIPSTRCKFLGFIIDSGRFTIELTTEKRERLEKLSTEFYHKKTCSIVEFSHLTGKLVAACPAIDYGWLYTKILEREKQIALIKNDYDYDSRMSVPASILPDLKWWKNNLKYGVSFIKTGDFEVTIFTDASSSGWGATDKTTNFHGFWNPVQKSWHINYKELFAVKLALESLADKLNNCQILLRIDNTTAIAYVNKMGGTKYPKYNSLARSIWQWAEKRKIFLFASYIASKDNAEADALSRMKNEDTEWELADFAYKRIVSLFGNFDIDLFATSQNTKCKSFISWLPCAEAKEIDAFTVNWSNLNFYAFPPFSLILRVLAKIKTDRASGVIIVPDWPSQPWYPLFQSLLVGKPVKFEPNDNLLMSACRKKQHPRASQLSLMAGRVSAKPT